MTQGNFTSFFITALFCSWTAAFAEKSSLTSEESLDKPDGKGRAPREIMRSQKQDSIASAVESQKRNKARETLLRSVRVDADKDDCIIFNRVARSCQVSVQKYNDLLPGFLPPEIYGEVPAPTTKLIQSIRQKALDLVLDQAFREHATNAYVDDAEFSTRSQFKGENLTVEMDSLITQIYQSNWVSLTRFQGKMDFEVYASTDSVLIDSLSRTLSRNKEAKSGKPKLDSTRLTAKSTAWVSSRVSVREAPDEWIRNSLSLVPRVWSEPIKTTFGFVLLRTNRKPPSIKECLPYLTQMAYFQKNSLPMKWDSLSLDFFKKNPSQFRAPDTLQLAVRLLPRPGIMNNRSTSISRSGDDSILHTISMARPMQNMSQLQLPPRVAKIITDHQKAKPNAAIKPFFLDYGFWWVQIASKKPGKGSASFELVREGIIANLKAAQADTALHQSGKIMASKFSEKTSQTAEEAWRKDLERTLQPEDFKELAQRDAEGNAGQKSSDTQVNATGSEMEAVQKHRIVEAKIHALKQAWISENFEIKILAL